MHIALAADCRRVAQALRHGGNRLHDLPSRIGGAGRRPPAEQLQRQRAAGPGAVVLGREIRAREALQVRIHIGGIDCAALARLVDVLEEFLARQIDTAPDDARQARVRHRNVMLDAALAAKVKPHRVAAHLHVPVAQRGEPVRPVLARVSRIAHANQRHVQQVDHGGQHLVARQARCRQLRGHRLAYARQRCSERQQPAVLVRIAEGPPVGVIAVLLAAPGVATGRLQMAVRVRTDPHIGIGRRDRQLVDARDDGGIADALAARIEVDEAAALAPPRVAGPRVVDIAQGLRQRFCGKGCAGGGCRRRVGGAFHDGCPEVCPRPASDVPPCEMARADVVSRPRPCIKMRQEMGFSPHQGVACVGKQIQLHCTPSGRYIIRCFAVHPNTEQGTR